MEGFPEIVCPRCHAPLAPDGEGAKCIGCSARFRGLRGILDLRTADDVYLANHEDWAFAIALDRAFDRVDFRGLLEHYFDLSPEIPPDLRRRQIEHIVSAPGRARVWLDSFRESPPGPLLDLGCGTGSFLACLNPRDHPAAGVDIAMRWLLVARKRLDEEGFGHVPLVCGCAEQLPFADQTFTRIVAGDVIEHVGDQPATLAEAHRVLLGGGEIFLASPNRFSLAPEPHVQVWGVGYLPRRWMTPYVRWVRNVDFRAIRTLGIGEWRRLIAQSPFRAATIRAAGLPDGDLKTFGTIKRAIARCYNAVVATGLGQAVARRIGPLFHVVCRRSPVGESTPPNRPTRRRSTHSAVAP